MTADEIKRALKTCSVPSACVGCVYKDADECIRALITDALDLIDDQDERIAIMQESMAALEKLNEQKETIPISWLKEKLDGHPELPYAVTDGIANVLAIWESEQAVKRE